VKLEVVRCLFHVPLSEFDIDEIRKITMILGTQNIGVGNTEIVLSYIFWILTKLVNDRDSEAGRTFRSKFGMSVINQALSILRKNHQRQVDDEVEEWEKYTLSLSILNFLKFVSKDSKLRAQLSNCAEILSDVLAND
jgi:hypothetical protein